MDVLKAVQVYVQKMMGDVPGMKVLLLDAHTVSCWSGTHWSQLTSDPYHLAGDDAERAIGQRGVPDRPYRQVSVIMSAPTDRSTSREPLTHLSCIAFLSPTHQSVEWVKQELANPRYGGYWLCGSSTYDGAHLQTSRTR